MPNTIDILFFGDIVGKPGRRGVHAYLEQLRNLGAEHMPDVVIANVENASHGFGLTEKNFNEIKAAGVDIMTSGNHIWDKRDILNYIDHTPELLRPENMAVKSAGRGYGVFDFPGYKVGVLNLIGQVFMGNYNSPWSHLDDILEELLQQTPVVFVDFHAEATAEKIALGHYLSERGVSAMTGTHTHVQTADNRILNERMGYITDSGFCGVHYSVIGMEVAAAVNRLRAPYPVRLDVAEDPIVQVNGTRFTIEPTSGECLKIERVNQIINLDATDAHTFDEEAEEILS